MKKFIALALALVMLLALAACGNTPAEETGDAEPTEISYWTFQELHVEYYEKMAEKWNEAYPDRPIKLVPTVYPFDDMHSNLLIALQSGTGAPDLVDIEVGKYANFLKGDIQLLPLNDIVEPELDNIVKARVDIYAKDGNYYGVCFHVGAAAIFYNTELCDLAGVDYTAIKTWDEYYEAAKALKAVAPDKYWESVETTDIWHMWPLLAELGGDMTAADGKITLDTPEMAKVLEYNRKLVDEGLAVCAPGGYHHAEEFYQLMNGGNIASIVMPLWYLDRFTNFMPDLSGKIAIAPLPVWEAGENRSIGQGGTGTSVTNQAKDPELTKDFLAFAKLSEEAGIEIWNTLGFDTIVKSVWEMDDVTHADNKFTQFYVNNPFDVLLEVKDEIVAHNNGENLPQALDIMKNSVLNRAYTEANVDIPAMLAEEQASVVY